MPEWRNMFHHSGMNFFSKDSISWNITRLFLYLLRITLEHLRLSIESDP